MSKRTFIKLICLLMFISTFMMNVSANDLSEYKTVKRGSLILNKDSEDLESDTLSTDYQLYKRESEENDLFDSYILETVSYYSMNGESFKIEHFTNDAAIVFESYNSSLTKLIGTENQFLTFFSGINNIMNGKMLSASKTLNTWEVSRTFYAGNRYFDNEYTFRYLTYFSVPKDNEVRVKINLYGVFEDVELDVNTIEIKYNLKK